MKKIMLLCCVTAFLSGCSPVNRFTRLRKLPRVYSENYQIPGIKAPKSGAHKKPWIVYSDREGNAAYVILTILMMRLLYRPKAAP